MSGTQDLERAVTAALESDPGINLHDSSLQVRGEGSSVSLEGEVGDIAYKRRAPLVAAKVDGVAEVVDHLAVRPDERQTDGQIRAELRTAFMEEPVFERHTLRMIDQTGAVAALREPEDAEGNVLFSVEKGVAYLDGTLNSLSHRWLAALLAWWIPGTRNVINNLGVIPAEEENAGELSEAVELALWKDSLLDGSLINVQAHDGVVVLGGTVHSERERTLAEHDAWYIEGTQEVDNRTVAP